MNKSLIATALAIPLFMIFTGDQPGSLLTASPLAEDDEPEVISLLGIKLYATPAEGEALEKLQADLAEVEKAVKAEPDNPELIIQYGRRLAGLWRYHDAIAVYSAGLEMFPEYAMLYRHRGHRYISTRRFDRAVDDLFIASQLNDSDFDIWYHLGLAQYLSGNFSAAEKSYLACLQTAADDDSLVAVSHWLYMTLRRQGKTEAASALLKPIREDMEINENASYHNLLLFYKGLKTEADLQALASKSDLDTATIGYGLGCWHLYNNDPAGAENYFRECISGKYWPAFGFIAAEAELARMRR